MIAREVVLDSDQKRKAADTAMKSRGRSPNNIIVLHKR